MNPFALNPPFLLSLVDAVDHPSCAHLCLTPQPQPSGQQARTAPSSLPQNQQQAPVNQQRGSVSDPKSFVEGEAVQAFFQPGTSRSSGECSPTTGSAAGTSAATDFGVAGCSSRASSHPVVHAKRLQHRLNMQQSYIFGVLRNESAVLSSVHALDADAIDAACRQAAGSGTSTSMHASSSHHHQQQQQHGALLAVNASLLPGQRVCRRTFSRSSDVSGGRGQVMELLSLIPDPQSYAAAQGRPMVQQRQCQQQQPQPGGMDWAAGGSAAAEPAVGDVSMQDVATAAVQSHDGEVLTELPAHADAVLQHDASAHGTVLQCNEPAVSFCPLACIQLSMSCGFASAAMAYRPKGQCSAARGSTAAMPGTAAGKAAASTAAAGVAGTGPTGAAGVTEWACSGVTFRYCFGYEEQKQQQANQVGCKEVCRCGVGIVQIPRSNGACLLCVQQPGHGILMLVVMALRSLPCIWQPKSPVPYCSILSRIKAPL